VLAVLDYLQHRSRSEFIAAVLDGLPEAPQYFKHNAALNQKGPEPVDWKAPPPSELTAEASLSDPAQHYVVDLRPAGLNGSGVFAQAWAMQLAPEASCRA